MKISRYGESPFFDEFLKKMAQGVGDFDSQLHPEDLPEMRQVEGEDELRSEQNSLSEALTTIDHLLEQVQAVQSGQTDPATLDFGYFDAALKDVKSAIQREKPPMRPEDQVNEFVSKMPPPMKLDIKTNPGNMPTTEFMP